MNKKYEKFFIKAISLWLKMTFWLFDYHRIYGILIGISLFSGIILLIDYNIYNSLISLLLFCAIIYTISFCTYIEMPSNQKKYLRWALKNINKECSNWKFKNRKENDI